MSENIGCKIPYVAYSHWKNRGRADEGCDLES